MNATMVQQERARLLRFVRPAVIDAKVKVHEEELAEYFYGKLILTGRLPEDSPDWSRLDEPNKDRVRLMIAVWLNSLDADKVRQAELRQREQMAQNGWQMDYSRLPPRYQTRINFLVKDANTTRDHAMQGVFSPLAPGTARRAELEPERHQS